MVDSTFISILSAISGVVAAGVAWLIADARIKTRLTVMEEKVDLVTGDIEKVSEESQKRISLLELATAKNEQAHIETTNNILRLDTTKASKEIVEGFRNEIHTLKSDMDKRFDRIERLLEKKDS